MMEIKAYTGSKGIHLVVLARCTNQNHLGDPCEGRAVRHVVSIEDIEDYGTLGAVSWAISRIFENYPGLSELIDH